MAVNRDLKPVLRPTGPRNWRNFHDSFKIPVKQYIDVWNGQPSQVSVEGYNATTKGLQNIIRGALRQNDPVRALGGGWSFSKVAATDGILLNTRPLNYRFKVNADQVHPDYNGGADNLAFVQCGISIAALNRYLMGRNKSIKTSGASNGQTIAGALSTGTHGSAFDVGAIQDYVLGLHLIVSPEKTVWIERESQPAVSDAYARAFQADEIIRDDEVFNAAVVSFGSFGIIHGIMLSVEDLFYLQASRQLIPANEALWQTCSTLDFPGSQLALPRANSHRPFHFQVVIDPFETGEAYVTTMYKDSVRALNCQPASSGSLISQGDTALEVVGAILDFAADITPSVVSILTRTFYSRFENVCGTHSEIFTDTTTRGKAASSAMGIPLGQVRQALNITLDTIKNFPAPVLVALRYVKASQATLAFTHHEPITCVMEIDGPKSRRVMAVYRRIWRALTAAGIPFTFHWGKINNLDAENVREMYGDQRINSWLKIRRQLLPTAKLRQTFANDFLKRLDLAD